MSNSHLRRSSSRCSLRQRTVSKLPLMVWRATHTGAKGDILPTSKVVVTSPPTAACRHSNTSFDSFLEARHFRHRKAMISACLRAFCIAHREDPLYGTKQKGTQKRCVCVTRTGLRIFTYRGKSNNRKTRKEALLPKAKPGVHHPNSGVSSAIIVSLLCQNDLMSRNRLNKYSVSPSYVLKYNNDVYKAYILPRTACSEFHRVERIVGCEEHTNGLRRPIDI